MRTVIHLAIIAAGLFVAAHLLDGVRFTTNTALIVAAVVLGIANAIVRPILVLLTLPITVLTLGLFYLVVNGVVFAITAALVPGFYVDSLGYAIAGALIVGLLSWLFGSATNRRTRVHPS